MRTVTEMFDKPQPEPWWKNALPGEVERPSKEELPEGYIDAYRIQSIVIDTSLYMEYLMETFKSLGGTVIQKEINDIQEALQDYELVVKKLEALSVETKKLEAIYKQKLADLEELKKSMLKRAFSGNL